ncbi:MAG TPA: alpha/beta fold hydrolase [Polyangiaceae bacterium]|jgi:pimeloyl-ACP methyl ester carboxylesterase
MLSGRTLLSGVVGLLLIGCSQGSEDVQTSTDALHKGGSDQVITVDHFVSVSNGVTLHVVEKYTDGCGHRPNHRALLMLSGTLVSSTEFNLPDPYNALDRAARAGYYAYAVDYEGYGESTLPADGKIVTAPRLLGEMGSVIEWIRHTRHVSRVDLLGSSLGSSLAVELGGPNSPINHHHVGKLVLTSVVYKNVTPAFQAAFFSPQFEQLLLTIPGGYIQTTPDAYAPIVLFADQAAADDVDAEVPGVYAVGPTLAGFTLPIYPAQDGRSPAMQFWGDEDPITPFSDLQQFQSEYGGDASYTVLSGSGHIPFYGPAKDTFWNDSFAFLEHGGDCWGGDCGDTDYDSGSCGVDSNAPDQSNVQNAKQSCLAW